MSSYLIRAIGVEDTIEVRLGTRLVGASGADRLERVTVEDGAGARAELPRCGVFVLIGAEPRSDWLPEAVAQDGRGFVLTGEALLDESGAPPARWTRARRPASLETSLPGVFRRRHPVGLREARCLRGRRGLDRDPAASRDARRRPD